MKILITGGFGFIGKRFLEKFSSIHDIIIISEKKQDFDFSKLKIEKIYFESIQSDKIKIIIQKEKPEALIHLAALTGLKKCQEDPQMAFEINVEGTMNVIAGCLMTRSKLIFLSSREVYGETKNFDSSEDDLLRPTNVYGLTKMIGEVLIQKAGLERDLDYTILRLSNVFGPGGFSGVNSIIKDAVSKKEVMVNGGKQIMNFIYIDDVVKIINSCLHNARISREIINLGSEDTIGLNDFVSSLEKIIGKFNVHHEEKPKFEVEYFRPNIEKMKKMLDIEKLTNLESGLKQSVKWFSENPKN